jgi:uncharacterized protein (TIGR03084 family)
VDPIAFAAHKTEAIRDADGFTAAVARAHRDLSGPDVLSWFNAARKSFTDAYRAIDPEMRVQWYGPDMSPTSCVTARIMETWAHGQDVFDALGEARPVSPNLHHVAHIGVRTFANSFRVRGLDVPAERFRVELLAPDGDTWAWGTAGAHELVQGAAEDFCLVVTQRRHLDDTALVVQGDVAAQWMSVAQAFAGPPGLGRQPGQFEKFGDHDG